jgi:hypothetical protein
MLDLILEKEHYAGVKKQLFIERLGETLKEFDTDLSIQEGICAGNNCATSGLTGICCLGNGNFFNLLIEEKNGNIVNLHPCCNLQCKKESYIGEEVPFKFWIEDKIFPEGEIFMKLQKADIAIEKLKRQRILSKTFIDYWLSKFKELDLAIGLVHSNSRLSIFSGIYLILYSITGYLDQRAESITAVNEYSDENEDKILNWLIKYEEMSMTKLIELKTSFEGRDFKDGLIMFRKGIFFKEYDLGPIFTFSDLFDKHYWDMLGKYSRLTQVKEISSLKELVERFRADSFIEK